MVCFLVLNCVILLLNGGLFYQMLTNEILMAQVPSWNGETVFVCGWASSLGMFTVSFVLYLIVFCADAGYTQSIAVDKFFVHLDKAIKEERNLDYFCFFCRTIWSSSGVHCMACGKCVEGFDHHCTFVNNCVGHKNHSWFLIFLFSALLYVLNSIAVSGWYVYRNTYICAHEGANAPPGDPFCGLSALHWGYDGLMGLFVLLALLQLLPVVWQIH